MDFAEFFGTIRGIMDLSSQAHDELKQAAEMIMACEGTVYLFGNGASASIAAHTATDLTKMCGIPALTFHDPNLLTCFVNDYGENWMRQCVKRFCKPDDLVILISSSGASNNIIMASDRCCKDQIPYITLSGFDKNNVLRKYGKVNLWVNSKEYNVVESVHFTWLAAIIEHIREKKDGI